MASGTWRGIVGVIKPTYSSGSLVEFIRLLPEGVGCIPMYAGIKEHSERGYVSAMETYHAKMAELAEIGVDLMHPEGGPPFMVRGHRAEQEIVGGWEAQYKVPIFTSGMSQAQALRALGIKKFVGCTYYRDQKMNDIFTRYFTDAGFEVLGMEGMDTSPEEADKISAETIYQHLKASFNKFPTAQGIYLLGSGAWGVKDIIAAENDLGIPVVHPVAARVWYVQKLLRVKNPLKGASRLLEELP
jgi:maleate cis-trans isomerase